MVFSHRMSCTWKWWLWSSQGCPKCGRDGYGLPRGVMHVEVIIVVFPKLSCMWKCWLWSSWGCPEHGSDGYAVQCIFRSLLFCDWVGDRAAFCLLIEQLHLTYLLPPPPLSIVFVWFLVVPSLFLPLCCPSAHLPFLCSLCGWSFIF